MRYIEKGAERMGWFFRKYTGLSACVICGRGRIREQNQDNYYFNGLYREKASGQTEQNFLARIRPPAMFAVADGMGGEQYGDEASLTAVKALRDMDPDRLFSGLDAAIEECNANVCALREQRGGAICGTTFAGVLFLDSRAVIANAGDSRVYLLHRHKLRLLTRDDTKVQMFLDAKLLTRQEADTHPDRHVLTQYLGISPADGGIRPHIREVRPHPGDIFLLCSDGLHAMVDDSRILSVLDASGGIEQKAEALFAAAMDAGGRDNISILLIESEA